MLPTQVTQHFRLPTSKSPGTGCLWCFSAPQPLQMTSSELSITSANHTHPVPKELLVWMWQTFYSQRDGGGIADTPHSCQGLSLCSFGGF